MQRPPTRYARNGELAIAYQVHGSGDRDLVFSGSVASHIEAVWQIPEAVELFERLGRFARVIRYDRRDSGQSDPIRDDLALEAHADDALAVMDAVGADRPVLWGGLDGARALALLAATRPDRVGGLITLAPSVRSALADSPELIDGFAQEFTDLEAYPERFLAALAPKWAVDPARKDTLMRYLQTSTTPRQAARAMRMSLASDIREVLPLVQARTLSLFPRDLTFPTAEAVKEFTDLVPDAEFRTIPGNAGLIYALDIGLIADIFEEFITGSAPAGVTDRVLSTVLFTDLVDSTRRAARSGDRAWAGLLDRHLEQTRAAITAHGGETIKSTGDGVLALFTGPGQGVRAAKRVIEDAAGLGLEVRTGLHTGEVERSRDDVAGLAVHLAARIMGTAGAGEVLTSRTVRDLVIGSELTFTDRGEHELKGIPDRWRIYAAA